MLQPLLSDYGRVEFDSAGSFIKLEQLFSSTAGFFDSTLQPSFTR